MLGLTNFVAALLSIIDYALNKPAVVDVLFGPFIRFYNEWVIVPLAEGFAAPRPDPRMMKIVIPEPYATLAAYFFVISLSTALLLWALRPATNTGSYARAYAGVVMVLGLAYMAVLVLPLLIAGFNTLVGR